MSTEFDAYQDKMIAHQRFQTGAAVAQTGLLYAQTNLMAAMAGSLNNIQAEMAAIRQLSLNGLAIQQEMLKREQLQNWLEEFIFNTQKMVIAFAEKTCDVTPSAKYFTLRGVLETVQSVGIGTALIRGRDNKAAFETAITGVNDLLTQLEKDSEVKEAIAWSEAENKRTTEENRRKQAEAQRAVEEKTAKQRHLIEQIAALRATRKPVSFTEWYSQKFGAFLKHQPPFSLPLLAKIPDTLYYLVATIVLWGPPPYLGLCFGALWIPIWYFISKPKIENSLNESVDRQIAALERELASLG